MIIFPERSSAAISVVEHAVPSVKLFQRDLISAGEDLRKEMKDSSLVPYG